MKSTVFNPFYQISLDPISIPSCPTPLNKRYEVLNMLMRECRKLYPTNTEIQKQVAIEQELKVAKRAKTKINYTSLSANLVKKLRGANPGNGSKFGLVKNLKIFMILGQF